MIIDYEKILKWDEDGEMCCTCKHVPDNETCEHHISGSCNLEDNMPMYERKEDRSDNEYNEKREFLRGEAGKMADNDVEYVALKDITLKSISNADIDPGVFKESVRIFGKYHIAKGSDLNLSGHVPRFIHHLLRLGFIEEKNTDYRISRGQCFMHIERGDIYRVAATGNTKDRVLSNVETGAMYGFACERPSYLSGLIGSNRLSEFKPVKVTITEVE